jgi:hypothetical protein
MTCLNHYCHRYTQIEYLLLKEFITSCFATRYIVSLLKNMTNENKAFRSLFKIAYY